MVWRTATGVFVAVSVNLPSVFDPQFERSKEGRLLAFNISAAHRKGCECEDDRGQMERDGRSVLVSAADIQAAFRPSLLGPQSLEFHRNRP